MTGGRGTGGFQATCRTRVNVAPEVAFKAWSDPAMLTAWMAWRETGEEGKARLIRVEDVEISPSAGAPFRVDMITREPDGTERTWVHEGEVLEADPPKRLSFSWISEGTHHQKTTVVLTFAPDEGGTLVTLEHSGFNSQDTADGHAEGWDLFLELFNEAMMTAASAGLKVTAAWLKQRLAARKAGGGADPDEAEAGDGDREERADGESSTT